VLFRPTPGGALTAQALKPLIELAQSKGAAALVLNDLALARTLRADGVHLSASADVMARYDDARSTLGARAIVGADAGGSRHVALELGEAGAEYVAFSRDTSLVATEPPSEDGDTAGVETDAVEDVIGPLSQQDLIAWWSEVLEVPCVAFDVTDADGAHDMAAAGADFVAVTCPVATSPTAVAAWYADIDRAVANAVESVDA
jgi:thiamine-phosphate pyrophosphorylase